MAADYISIVLMATFTGIGTALGLSIYELFLKERIHAIGHGIKCIPKKVGDIHDKEKVTMAT